MNYKLFELHIKYTILSKYENTFHSNNSLFSVEFPLLWNVTSAQE